MPQPKKIVLPDDAREALRAGGVLQAFGKLVLSRQREYTLAIEEAKQPEARRACIEKMVAALQNGKS